MSVQRAIELLILLLVVIVVIVVIFKVLDQEAARGVLEGRAQHLIRQT